MKDELNTDNDVEADGTEGISASPPSAPLERRPSLVRLQFMLRKVSQSPFHHHSAESPASDSDGSPQNDSDNKQNEAGGGLTRTNPFYQHYLESSSNGYAKEDDQSGSSDAVFGPAGDFHKSHADLLGGRGTVQREALSPEPSRGRLQTEQASAWADEASRTFHQEAQSDLGPQTMNFSSISPRRNPQLVQSPVPAAEVQNSIPVAFTGEGTCLEKRNPFETPPSDADLSMPASHKGSLESSGSAGNNPFYRTPNQVVCLRPAEAKHNDLFIRRELAQESPMKGDDFRGSEVKDIFASPASAGNTFSSPATRDLFPDFTNVDPFASPLSDPDGDFQKFSSGALSLDIFQPRSSAAESRDLFETPQSSRSSTLPPSTPSLEVSPDPTTATAGSWPGPSQEHRPIAPSLAGPPEVVLTTPQGSKQNILQPTPFTRARNLRLPSSQTPPAMTHVSTVKRPPKPLPRTRAPPPKEKPPVAVKPDVTRSPAVPERPPKPVAPVAPVTPSPSGSEKPPSRPAMGPLAMGPLNIGPLARPAMGRGASAPEGKWVDREDFMVFQDILLIGQEKCVEDWPEDSPELSPDFKPSGTLRLRRESLKAKADSDGGSGEDQDGSGTKKKDGRFRMSLQSRRGSKERFSDDAKEGRSRTLPSSRKSSKEYSSDLQMSAEENGEDLSGHKKKPLKHRVSRLLRRASSGAASEGKRVNGNVQPKDGSLEKRGATKKASFRRWSEGTALDDSSAEEVEEDEDEEEEEEEEEQEAGLEAKQTQKKKKVKIKFVPQRGFTITLEKPDDLKGAHGYTPPRGCKEGGAEDAEELQQLPCSKAALQNGERSKRALRSPSGFGGREFNSRLDNCKPTKARHKGDDPSTGDYDGTGGQTDAVAFSHHLPRQASNVFAEEDFTNLPVSPHSLYDTEQDELGVCKQKKSSKFKGLKKLRAKKKTVHLQRKDPPGAASTDFLSDAARAEWLAAQRDEQGVADVDDEEEDGDTDSLMEWWYTVEQWDELPSDDEDKTLREDESKSFSILAEKVQRGLQVFNKVFTERAEVLWQSIIQLHAIAENISTVHQKAKIAGITGGTTTAVGGVAAIAGLALAPLTFGASLVVTAVGVGVATAGGITSASAAISDNINNMHDRKKVELILEEYEGHLLDIGKILHFVNQGLYKLRGHPFLRSGTQHYSEDWEVRRAVQMIGLVDAPVVRAVELTDSAVLSVQGLFKGMDKYFVKDSRELKKGCKKEIVAEIKEVAHVLNDTIVTLNAIREELQEATGYA